MPEKVNSIDLPVCTLSKVTPKPGKPFSWYAGVAFDAKISELYLPTWLAINVKPCNNQFWWFTSVLYIKNLLGHGLQ